DPPRPHLFDVRLLLSLHPRRVGTARRRAPRSLGEPGRVARADAVSDHAPPPAPLAPGRRAPHLHDRARLVLGALSLRRQLPGHDDADRRLEAERRDRRRAGRDPLARRARARRALGAAANGARLGDPGIERRPRDRSRPPPAGPALGPDRDGDRRRGALGALPPAARGPRPDLLRAAVHLDEPAAASRLLARELPGPRLGRAPAADRQLALDG